MNIPCPNVYDILLNTILNPEDRKLYEMELGLLSSKNYNLVPKYTVIYGNSPSGKSTLMNILAGVVGEPCVSYGIDFSHSTKQTKVMMVLDGNADKVIKITKNNEYLKDVKFFIATNKLPKSTNIPLKIIYTTDKLIDWPIYETFIRPAANELITPYRWYCIDRLTENLEREIE